MKALETDSYLIDGYIKLLSGLSPGHKLDLISRLTISIKSDLDRSEEKFYESFGAWDSKESADELIKVIRDSRNFERKIEGLGQNSIDILFNLR